MAALGLDKLKQYIKTIGLYNNKAKNIIALSKELTENIRAKCRITAKHWKTWPALAVKPPMLF